MDRGRRARVLSASMSERVSHVRGLREQACLDQRCQVAVMEKRFDDRARRPDPLDAGAGGRVLSATRPPRRPNGVATRRPIGCPVPDGSPHRRLERRVLRTEPVAGWGTNGRADRPRPCRFGPAYGSRRMHCRVAPRDAYDGSRRRRHRRGGIGRRRRCPARAVRRYAVRGNCRRLRRERASWLCRNDPRTKTSSRICPSGK